MCRALHAAQNRRQGSGSALDDGDEINKSGWRKKACKIKSDNHAYWFLLWREREKGDFSASFSFIWPLNWSSMAKIFASFLYLPPKFFFSAIATLKAEWSFLLKKTENCARSSPCYYVSFLLRVVMGNSKDPKEPLVSTQCYASSQQSSRVLDVWLYWAGRESLLLRESHLLLLLWLYPRLLPPTTGTTWLL